MSPVSQPFAAATFQEPWSASAWDSLRLFSLHLVAIGGSGALARTALAPLERIKVPMPTQSRCCQQIYCESDAVPLRLAPLQILLQVESISNTPPMQRYGSFNHAIWRINQREGFKVSCDLDRSKARTKVESICAKPAKLETACWVQAYFRGNGANVLRLLPDTAIKFALHDQFKVMFAPPDGRPLGLTGKLAAGSATGVIKCLASYPLELARTRLAADTSSMGQARLYRGIAHCMSHTWRHEGTRGLYKGMVASIAAVVPYLAISFTTYDELQSRLPNDRGSRAAWWYGFTKLGSGAAAGLLASTLVYPVDTVRRQMQVMHSSTELCLLNNTMQYGADDLPTRRIGMAWTA